MADVEVDPSDGRIVFAVAGGIQRSADAGRSWKTLATSFPVDDLAIAASDPQIIYTGGYHDFRRTQNGGRTWIDLSQGLGGRGNIVTVAVDPTNADKVYVGKSGGQAYRSTDGGQAWTPMLGIESIYVEEIVVDPSNSDTLYAASQLGIDRSLDAGVTWERVNHGIRGNAVAVAVDPTDGSTVYAANDDGLFRSDDGAESWLPVGSELADGTIRAIELVPADPSVVYAALYPRGLAKSTDRGETWTHVPVEGEGRSVAVDGGSGTIFAGTSYGIYRSEDEGTSWRLSSDGIAGLVVSRVVFAPSDPGRVYGSSSAGVYRSDDGGLTWEAARRGLGGDPIGDLAVSPDDPDVAFVTVTNYITPSRLYRTTDGGAHWQPSSEGIDANTLIGVAFDPFDGSIVYTIASDGLYRSVDAGRTWTGIPIPGVDYGFAGIAIDPTDGERLYVMSMFGVDRSEDGGTSWSRLIDGDFYQVVVNPLDPTVIYAGGVWLYRSRDDGTTWELLSNGIEHVLFNTVGIDPVDPDAVYVAGCACPGWDVGLFRSTDGGDSFELLSRGLPDLSILSIKVDPSEHRRVLIGMDGGSVYALESA